MVAAVLRWRRNSLGTWGHRVRARSPWVLLVSAALALCVPSSRGLAIVCSTAGCVPGGGGIRTDCLMEWLVTPVPPPASDGLPSRNLICYEGDPLCDADLDIDDARCVFSLTPCINNDDARMLACAPTDVAAFEVRKPSATNSRDAADLANLAALESGANQGLGLAVLRHGHPFLSGMPNTSLNTCGSPIQIEVPLHQAHSGRLSRGRKKLRLESTDSNGTHDSDTLKL